MSSKESMGPAKLSEVGSSGAVALDVEFLLAPILDEVCEELVARNSKLISDGQLDPVFVQHAQAILAETMSVISYGVGDFPSPSVDYRGHQVFHQTGELRARQGLHPAESLMAAELLFDRALPPLATFAEGHSGLGTSTISVARALHHAIWRRFPPGAIAYAETLRQRLFAADLEVRKRVSRELHDRVAHAIVTGLNRIEVSRVCAATEAGFHLDLARQVLSDALCDVQDIAVELRQLVGDRPLSEAISDYIADTSDISSAIELRTSGVAVDLPPSVGEEAFTIVREALRNARTHAQRPSEIQVSTAWEANCATIIIEDNGPGFDPKEIPPESIGLQDMHERAESIGAQLLVISNPLKGTSVRLTIPIRGSTPSV